MVCWSCPPAYRARDVDPIIKARLEAQTSHLLLLSSARLMLWCQHQFWITFGLGGLVALTVVTSEPRPAAVFLAVTLVALASWFILSRPIARQLKAGRAEAEATLKRARDDAVDE